jgi:hypothetical protein
LIAHRDTRPREGKQYLHRFPSKRVEIKKIVEKTKIGYSPYKQPSYTSDTLQPYPEHKALLYPCLTV